MEGDESSDNVMLLLLSMVLIRIMMVTAMIFDSHIRQDLFTTGLDFVGRRELL